MSFPITVNIFSRRHTGSTKDYHAILLSSGGKNSNSLLITRYGKSSAWGTVDTAQFSALSSGTMAFQKKCREKASRHYSIPIVLTTSGGDGQTKTVRNMGELSDFIGERYLRDMNRDDRLHLFGSDDVVITTADKELLAMVEADAKLAAEGIRRREEDVARRKAEKEEAARLKREAEEAASTARSIAKNQTWGMF